MAKKKHHEEHENHERWLVSYADFITLLFAFFTVLYATSQKDIAKAKEFEQSIKRAFNTFMDFGGIQGDNISFEKEGSLLPPPIPLYLPPSSTPEQLEEAVEDSLSKSLSSEEMQNYISNIRHDSLGVTISLAANSVFPSGSAEISEAAMNALSKVGSILTSVKNQLIIQGHTDSLPLSNSQYQSNWELSSARATQIVHYLIKRHKIQPSRLVAVAYADQRPLATNSTEAGRSKNRRIEILMVTGDSKL